MVSQEEFPRLLSDFGLAILLKKKSPRFLLIAYHLGDGYSSTFVGFGRELLGELGFRFWVTRYSKGRKRPVGRSLSLTKKLIGYSVRENSMQS